MAKLEGAILADEPMLELIQASFPTILPAPVIRPVNNCGNCSNGVPRGLPHRYLIHGFMHCGKKAKLFCAACRNDELDCRDCLRYDSRRQKYICPYSDTCEMFLSNSTTLVQHEKLTHSEDTKLCRLCTPPRVLKNVKRHHARYHPDFAIIPGCDAAQEVKQSSDSVERTGETLLCCWCEATLQGSNSLSRHIRTAHQGNLTENDRLFPLRRKWHAGRSYFEGLVQATKTFGEFERLLQQYLITAANNHRFAPSKGNRLATSGWSIQKLHINIAEAMQKCVVKTSMSSDRKDFDEHLCAAVRHELEVQKEKLKEAWKINRRVFHSERSHREAVQQIMEVLGAANACHSTKCETHNRSTILKHEECSKHSLNSDPVDRRDMKPLAIYATKLEYDFASSAGCGF